MERERKEIDFVITWVDGNDPVWRWEKSQFTPQKNEGEPGKCGPVDDREERYRDYELLRYWFRGVEAYAPWVRYIHFVTYGHLPDWLDTDHPKLRIVRHADYIPNEYLPTYNSNAIEIFMHRIPDLAEKFVYFNDDMLLMHPLGEDFFFTDGKPNDMLAFQPVVANPANPVMSHLLLNESLVLAKHFDKRENVRQHPGNYFKFGYPPLYFFYNLLELAFPKYTGFYSVHGPMPFLRSSFEHVWAAEEKTLLETGKHRFRSKDDMVIYLFRDWQKLEGNFTPKNITKNFAYYELSEDNRALKEAIAKRKKWIMCVNDANEKLDFEKTKAEIQTALERALPRPCSYEKKGNPDA